MPVRHIERRSSRRQYPNEGSDAQSKGGPIPLLSVPPTSPHTADDARTRWAGENRLLSRELVARSESTDAEVVATPVARSADPVSPTTTGESESTGRKEQRKRGMRKRGMRKRRESRFWEIGLLITLLAVVVEMNGDRLGGSPPAPTVAAEVQAGLQELSGAVKALNATVVSLQQEQRLWASQLTLAEGRSGALVVLSNPPSDQVPGSRPTMDLETSSTPVFQTRETFSDIPMAYSVSVVLPSIPELSVRSMTDTEFGSDRLSQDLHQVAEPEWLGVFSTRAYSVGASCPTSGWNWC